MGYWQTIESLEGQVLRTPALWNDFEVRAVTESLVIVAPKVSGEEREITREQVKELFFDLMEEKRITLEQIESRYGSHNGSYMCGVLAEHDRVRLRTNPVRLIWHVEEESRVPEGELEPSEADFDSVPRDDQIDQLTFWQRSED